MIFDTYTIIYLIMNVFSIAVNHRFMRAFFEQRHSKMWMCALSYFLYFAVTSLLYLYVDIPFVTLLANYALILLISLNYKADMKKRVLSCLYILAFCAISGTIIAACTGYFQYSIFTEGNYSNSVGIIAIRLVTYMEALLLYNFKSVRRKHGVKLSVWMAAILIPVITFILHVFIVHSKTVTQIEVIVASLLILLANVTAFYLYDSLATSYMKLSRAAVLEKEREFYYNQCAMMQSSTEELRAFRHDLKNQLIGVSELMNAEEYDDAKGVVEGLSGKLNTKVLFSTTGIIPIDSIINYKLQNTGNEQIRVETEITVPTDFVMDISDCITILGNLLDNALHAVRQVEETERFLKLKVVYDKESLVIRCENSYVTEVQYE